MRNEHRRALEILNERFSGHTAFFGVELTSVSERTPLSDPVRAPRWRPWSFHAVVRPESIP
jgi:hypothetical protein